MARKATAAAAIPSDHDPLGWLYLNPSEPGFTAEEGYSFGVLRRAYRGRANSAEEFCRRKAQPIAPGGDATAEPWQVTAAQVDVWLPEDADDRFSDPQALCREVDCRVVEADAALLTYVTLAFPSARRLHQAWKAARKFAEAMFVEARSLPVIQILHAPHLAGSSNPVHCHLLIVPRVLDGLGLRGFDTDLTTDRGQQIIHSAWLDHKAAQGGTSHG